MKVGIIGHLGGQHSFTDGQTVKTKALVGGLRKKGYSDLIIADTYYMKKNPAVFFGSADSGVFENGQCDRSSFKSR